MDKSHRIDMQIAKILPTYVAFPILLVAVLLGMLVGTIYGEIISEYRTWRRGRG